MTTEAQTFESVFELYRPKVFRFVLALLRDRDAAETITTDCFLKAYDARDRFRRQCSLDTWLMHIAANLVRDYVRNRRSRFWIQLRRAAKPVEVFSEKIENGQCSPEAQALRKEQVEAVWAAADKLPPRQRVVFLLRFVEEMNLLDIAAVTGMKEGTVKVHLSRALQTVRARLGSTILAALITVITLASLSVYFKEHRRSAPAISDNVLLDRVSAEVLQTAPRALQPLEP